MRRGKRIVFVGNCQLEALARLYSQVVAGPEESVEYLAAYQGADDQQRAMVAEADILLRQVVDFAPAIGDLNTSAQVHLIPHISAPFLWPYTGRPHPRNAPAPFLDANGPYPAELGDSFLDRMIAARVPAEEAARIYLDTDVATVRRAGRMAEILLDNQRSRDRACGTDFADMIATRFRTERLFLSPNHPAPELASALVREAFGRIGADASVLESLRVSPPQGMFPLTETPVHPSVIAHFGLHFVTPETRYPYFNEGRFTFAEFAARYMRYEWHPGLAEAFHLFWNSQEDAAVDAFIRAVPTAPRSGVARLVLSELLSKRGRMHDALNLARQACALEPENARYRDHFEWIKAQPGMSGQA